MADSPELNTPGAETPETPNTDEKVVTLKQTELDKIVQKAMGRAAGEVRQQLTSANNKLADMERELADLREKANDKSTPSGERSEANSDAKDLQRQIEEMKTARNTLDQEMQRLKQQVQQRERDATEAHTELLKERKNSFINSMLDDPEIGIDWVNKKVARQLVEDNIKWDAEKGRFTIVNEDGQEKLNTQYDPMTPQEFVVDFASKNDYLVRSKAKPGVGSAESAGRTGVPGKYTVDQIFGPKSNSRLANQLAMNDIKEYQRLKVEAKRKGLIG